jgi:RimJ/RimL family protein N-acetyltransferase
MLRGVHTVVKNRVARETRRPTMRYAETVLLQGGVELLVRNAVASDARALRDIMQRTHAETDYLLSYPDEQSVDDEQEARALAETERSDNEVELVAVVDGKIVGSAGVTAAGSRRKVLHRARFGISILKEHWGMGIGRVLMEASIDCARQAGYTQLELEVVADNERAVSLYRCAGFEEYGRNPRGYRSTAVSYQELVHMRLEL